MAIGMVLGLTPLMSLHNLAIMALVMLFRVSFPAVTLGWFVAIPLGFALDPIFNSFGLSMLETLQLNPIWTTITNAPILALANLNNSVVLGSLVVWLLAVFPMYLVFKVGVTRYRETIYARLSGMKIFKTIRRSKAYNFYRLFRPE